MIFQSEEPNGVRSKKEMKIIWGGKASRCEFYCREVRKLKSGDEGWATCMADCKKNPNL